MSSIIAEHGGTREAFTFQVLFGISIVCCLIYFHTLVTADTKTLCGAANVVGAGSLSGGLHALSGPDHLAALLPFVLGQKWHKAAYFGSIWGLGHGLTTSLMGVLGFYVKDSLLAYRLLPQLANLADYAVGLTLIIIGVMGIYELRNESEAEKVNENEALILTDAVKTIESDDQHFIVDAVEIKAANPLSVLLTIFLNGCFLGMSWDGLPSLAPTLALYSWQLLSFFLVAYIAGTVLTISAASGFIGESTKWLSTVTCEDLPRRLALVSSYCAIAIGIIWIIHALVKLKEVTEVASASSVSWVLCCAIALGSPVALVGIIILAFNKESLQTDQNNIKNTTKSEPESSTQDLNPENVRYRRHLGVVPTLWTGTIEPVQTV